MSVYEVTHNYLATEIFELQFSQINDVVYISHPNHRTKKLTRYAANNWTLTDFDFIGGPFMTDNTDTSILITASSSSGTVDITVSPTSTSLFTVSGTTIGHTNAYWKIGSTVTDSTTGLNVQGYVKLTNIVNAYTATATVMKVLSTVGPTSEWAEGAWSAVRGYPARNTFFQQRLFFARTNGEPQTVWGSKPFIYDDFSVDGGYDDDALNIELASNESNDIKWLAPSKTLIAGTYGGEYTIGTGDGSTLTPSNTNVIKQTSWGSEPIVPKKIGNYYYYVQRFAKKLRELFYFWDLDTYKSVDKTILSPHVTGDGIVDLAYQQNPDTVLWCVTTNGTIATLTREVDQEVQGWSRQTTDGSYESIATIPSQEGPHDEVWVVVKRTIGGDERRYIERFVSQEVPERQDKCWYVHSGLTYDAYEATTTPTATTISLSATAGTTVVVTSSAVYFSADDIGQRIRAINSDGETVGELHINGFTSSTIVFGDVRYDFDATSYTSGTWGVSVSAISGLDHLEAKEVVVLADGGLDKPNKTVSGGSITLGYDYFVVTAGLPYTQKLKTVPQEAGAQRGTAVGKIQRISEIALKVNRSHRGIKIGGSDDEMQKISFRQGSTVLGTPEALYTGVIPNLTFRNDYKYGSQVQIHNEDPLPVEILSIVTSLDTNEK